MFYLNTYHIFVACCRLCSSAHRRAPRHLCFSPASFNHRINEFSHAIKKGPGHATAYSNCVLANMMQKKYNLALDDLKKAKELKPKDSAIRYNLASCHSLMGDVDLGFVEFDAVLAPLKAVGVQIPFHLDRRS